MVEWAQPLLSQALEDEDDFGGLVDLRLENNYVGNEMCWMISIIAACLHYLATRRSIMSTVVRESLPRQGLKAETKRSKYDKISEKNILIFDPGSGSTRIPKI